MMKLKALCVLNSLTSERENLQNAFVLQTVPMSPGEYYLLSLNSCHWITRSTKWGINF